MEEGTKIAPCTPYSHDEKERNLLIEAQRPGVDKKGISLEMTKDSFCVSAHRDRTEYSGRFLLSRTVEPEKAKAKCEHGLLSIAVPIKDWQQTVNVTVQ